MKRNNLDIFADILRVSKDGAKKTHLVYNANLNFNIVKKYMNELLENELLKQNGDRFYQTEKGARFIAQYEELLSPLSERHSTRRMRHVEG